MGHLSGILYTKLNNLSEVGPEVLMLTLLLMDHTLSRKDVVINRTT